jgi:citrate lyase subunit beta / citryl-CoA lyase
MILDTDLCRSLLFLPAGNERFLKSALNGSADVILLDLEDAISHSEKNRARERVGGAVLQVHEAGRVCAVRVNNGLRLLAKDLEAVVCAELSALIIPKVSSAEYLQLIDEAVTELEHERGIPMGNIRLVAQIETAQGVLNLNEIARATPRLAALGIGPEDLAADLGSGVDPDALYHTNMQALIAARAAGIVPLGYIGSITVYKEKEIYREWIQRARKLGFEGAFCIHPNQVEILNEEFLPSEAEATEAGALVEAFEAHRKKGIGAFAFQGRLVDAPIMDRAIRVLKRWRIGNAE